MSIKLCARSQMKHSSASGTLHTPRPGLQLSHCWNVIRVRATSISLKIMRCLYLHSSHGRGFLGVVWPVPALIRQGSYRTSSWIRPRSELFISSWPLTHKLCEVLARGVVLGKHYSAALAVCNFNLFCAGVPAEIAPNQNCPTLKLPRTEVAPH